MTETGAPPEPAHDADAPPPVKALFSRVLRNTAYLLTGRGAIAVLSLGTTALAARALGLQGYGVLMLMYSFATSCSIATRLQSWQPLLQYGTRLFGDTLPHSLQTLVRHCLVLDAAGAVAGTSIALGLTHWASPLLGWSAAYGPVPEWFMTAVLFMNTGTALGVMRLANRFDLSVTADAIASFLRFVGSLAGFFLHWPLSHFMLVWYGASAVSFALDYTLAAWLLWRVQKLSGFRLLRAPWFFRVEGIWRFIFSVSINQALGRLVTRAAVLLVGAVLGPQSAALYNVTWQISDGLTRPGQMVTPALYPELVVLKDRKDWASLRRVTTRILQVVGVFSVVLFATAFLIGPWLLHVLLTVPWSGTRTLLLLMTMTAIFDLWNVPLEPLMMSLEKAHHVVLGRLATTLFFLPLLYVLARDWGMTGAGVATLLNEMVVLITRLVPYWLITRRQGLAG